MLLAFPGNFRVPLNDLTYLLATGLPLPTNNTQAIGHHMFSTERQTLLEECPE